MAMEMPFVIVGAVLLGGVLGFFLDRWFHTKPWLMMVFGALGFFGAYVNYPAHVWQPLLTALIRA